MFGEFDPKLGGSTNEILPLKFDLACTLLETLQEDCLNQLVIPIRLAHCTHRVHYGIQQRKPLGRIRLTGPSKKHDLLSQHLTRCSRQSRSE